MAQITVGFKLPNGVEIEKNVSKTATVGFLKDLLTEDMKIKRKDIKSIVVDGIVVYLGNDSDTLLKNARHTRKFDLIQWEFHVPTQKEQEESNMSKENIHGGACNACNSSTLESCWKIPETKDVLCVTCMHDHRIGKINYKPKMRSQSEMSFWNPESKRFKPILSSGYKLPEPKVQTPSLDWKIFHTTPTVTAPIKSDSPMTTETIVSFQPKKPVLTVICVRAPRWLGQGKWYMDAPATVTIGALKKLISNELEVAESDLGEIVVDGKDVYCGNSNEMSDVVIKFKDVKAPVDTTKWRFYDPAWSHYGKETNVPCDVCETENLLTCYGLPGVEDDLCVTCMIKLQLGEITFKPKMKPQGKLVVE